MAKITKRGNSNNYYIRYQIPKEFQKKAGAKEKWKSLNTSDKKEAERRSHSVLAKIIDDLNPLETEFRPAVRAVEPTFEKMEEAAIEYYFIQNQVDLDERADGYGESAESLRLAAEETRRELSENDCRGVDTEHWSDYFGFAFNEGSRKKAVFAQLLMRAQIEAFERAAEQSMAVFGGAPKDPLFQASRPSFASGRDNVAEISRVSELNLNELFELHAKDYIDHLKSATLTERQYYVELFSEFVGNGVAPSDMTKKHARDWKNALREWPLKARQKNIFKEMSFSEVLEKNKTAEHETITDVTLAKYISQLSAMFAWMVNEGRIKENIFNGLLPKKKKDEGKKVSFTAEQLNYLFSSPLFVGSESLKGRGLASAGSCKVNDWRKWLLLLAAFTGARQSELYQLELADIRSTGGIDFLAITNLGHDPRKSVKNRSSKRSLPIHSKLIELGFLDLVAEQRAAGQSNLFSGVRRDTKGLFGGVSKFYSNYFKQIGLCEFQDDKVTFHSLRHNFVDELRDQFSDAEFGPILGHSGNRITAGYGVKESLSLRRRQEMIETVSYDGVRFQL